MYTGVVAGTGAVRALERDEQGYRIRLSTGGVVDPEPGDSVAVSGVCLTAERVGERWFEERWFSAHLSAETARRTYLTDLGPGDPVNLESPVAPDGSLDGHLVRGVVDATAEVVARESIDAPDDEETATDGCASDGRDGNPETAHTAGGWRYSVSIPDGFGPYLAEKGAVAIDGISLTVTDVADDRFAVAVVPETRERTTLSATGVGDPVHLEADPLARYVQRQEANAAVSPRS